MKEKKYPYAHFPYVRPQSMRHNKEVLTFEVSSIEKYFDIPGLLGVMLDIGSPIGEV